MKQVNRTITKRRKKMNESIEYADYTNFSDAAAQIYYDSATLAASKSAESSTSIGTAIAQTGHTGYTGYEAKVFTEAGETDISLPTAGSYLLNVNTDGVISIHNMPAILPAFQTGYNVWPWSSQLIKEERMKELEPEQERETNYFKLPLEWNENRLEEREI